MLLQNLILLIDVTFSTLTGHYTCNRWVTSVNRMLRQFDVGEIELHDLTKIRKASSRAWPRCGPAFREALSEKLRDLHGGLQAAL